MLKKHMAACLVATAFAAAPALAQTSPAQSGATDRPAASGSGSTTTGSPAMQPGSPAMQPGAAGSSATSAPAAGAASSTMGSSTTTTTTGGSSTMAQSGSMQGQFMTQMQANQLMASDLIGTRVISSNNESIGDINDVILDRNGQVVAAVIGVGGFLGIGEKDVAVPFGALEFASREQVSAMVNNNAPSATGSTAGPATTGVSGGSTNTTVGGASSTASNSAEDNQPERVILRMTKAELQAAPRFDADGDEDAKNTSTGSTGVGGQSGAAPIAPAPKQ